eukprot:3821153-Pleurochrysis_carterae.AAC.1
MAHSMDRHRRCHTQPPSRHTDLPYCRRACLRAVVPPPCVRVHSQAAPSSWSQRPNACATASVASARRTVLKTVLALLLARLVAGAGLGTGHGPDAALAAVGAAAGFGVGAAAGFGVGAAAGFGVGASAGAADGSDVAVPLAGAVAAAAAGIVLAVEVAAWAALCAALLPRPCCPLPSC